MNKKEGASCIMVHLLDSFSAERQGFEPRVPRGTTVFKTAAIDHSATSPKLPEELFFSKAMQRYGYFLNMQISNRFFDYFFSLS